MEQSENLFLKYVDTIQVEATRNNLLSTYKWVERFESNHGVQIQDFNREEFLQLLNSQNSAVPNTVRNRILMFRGFYNWLIRINYRIDSPAQNVSVSDVDLVSSCRIHYFRNFTDLSLFLSRYWPIDEGFHIHPISVFAWLGISKQEAELLSNNQIDLLSGCIIDSSGNSYTLTDVMEDVLNAFSQFKSSTRNNNITMLRSYNTDLFLSRWDIQNGNGKSKEYPVDITDVLGAASRELKRKNIVRRISYDDIAKSGMLNKMYLAEKAGESEDSILSIGNKVFKVPRGFPSDIKIIYNAYKQAFGLK